MKKKSRFLTGLLSAVMALSLCALPAAAAENGSDTTTKVPTITKTTGSLTINKYEGAGRRRITCSMVSLSRFTKWRVLANRPMALES